MNRQEAQELLPWFVAGTLNEAETIAVQAFIDSGEISQAELDELALFRDTVAEQSTYEPAYNPTILDNVMAQLEDTPQDAPVEPLIVSEPTQTQPGFITRLLDRLQWSATPLFSKLAIGAQFVAVLALAIMVATPSGDLDEDAQFEVVSGTISQADITVAFAPGASEAEIRALLQGLEAQIVEGPNSLGMYGIALPDTVDLNMVQQQLSASALTSFVQPVALQ
jgi:hypothetical protein